MLRKTPQQKKSLSYTKDRRNCYGENSKSSRKNIPKTKARTRRAYRHKVDESLHQVNGAISQEELEQQESDAASVRRKEWKKLPDEPLAQHITTQTVHRKARENKKKVLKDNSGENLVGQLADPNTDME